MTEPKYCVGQKVAVCTKNLAIVIPETTVEGMRFDRAGIFIDSSENMFFAPEGWAYFVEGAKNPFCEHCLRPLNDDDYTDIEELKEIEA